GAPIDRSARKRGDPLEVLLLVGVRRLELGDGNAKVAHGMLSTRVAVRSITPDRNVREDGARARVDPIVTEATLLRRPEDILPPLRRKTVMLGSLEDPGSGG